MAVDKDKRNGQWRYRKRIYLSDGKMVRVSGTPQINTKRAAEDAERAQIERVLRGLPPKHEIIKEVPTFQSFAKTFLDIAASKNKHSEVASKESMLRVHLVPVFGKKRLHQIAFDKIQDYVAQKLASGLSKKTVNNHLTVLRTMLVTAKKRGLIDHVPDIEWQKAPKPDFDFFDFEEADRLVEAAKEGRNPDFAVMILLALRTGLRQGEILALRWEDVDLEVGTVHVRQSVSRGIIGTPKSNRARMVPLSAEAVRVLKAHRHLRGPYVFSVEDGRMIGKNECRKPLAFACKKAGLRQLGWHALRHSFASHLVMRGVSLKAIQELLGHATIEMTMRYAHLSPHVTKNAVQLLDQRELANGKTGQQVANNASFASN